MPTGYGYPILPPTEDPIFLPLRTLKASFKTLKANIFLRGISTYTSIRRITKDEDMTS